MGAGRVGGPSIRKSTMIILLLLLMAGAGTLFMADVVLGPRKEDVAAGKRLTSLFGERGELAPGTAVRLLRVADDKVHQGPGLHVEVTPAEAVLARPDGVRELALAVAREVPAAYAVGVAPPHWYRVRVFFPGGATQDAWMVRDPEGDAGEPEPPFPATWPPPAGGTGAKPPAPPAPPGPAPGSEPPPAGTPQVPPGGR